MVGYWLEGLARLGWGKPQPTYKQQLIIFPIYDPTGVPEGWLSAIPGWRKLSTHRYLFTGVPEGWLTYQGWIKLVIGYGSAMDSEKINLIVSKKRNSDIIYS